MMEYDVITFVHLNNLIRKVNEQIKKGWQPLGGINCDAGFYSQAMVRHSYTDELELLTEIYEVETCS